MTRFSNIFKVSRVNQYLKNVFILFPAFFAMKFTDIDTIKNISMAFISFSLISSAVYVFNDIKDRQEDQNHPIKKHRPIASGEITLSEAFKLIAIYVLFGIVFAISLNESVIMLILAYMFMNLLYSQGLKNFAIVDVMIIALGFVLRIFVGAYAAGIEPTHWIVTLTFLLALFLGFAKRRDDQILIENRKLNKKRQSHSGYNIDFINSTIVVLASLIIMTYMFWTLSPSEMLKFNSNNIYFSSFFVLLGVMRYMQLIFVKNKTGDPTMVLIKDRVIQVSIILWLLSLYLVIYS